jgi:hypothetical protein
MFAPASLVSFPSLANVPLTNLELLATAASRTDSSHTKAQTCSAQGTACEQTLDPVEYEKLEDDVQASK